MRCTQCGNEFADGYQTCPYCGAAAAQPAAYQQPQYDQQAYQQQYAQQPQYDQQAYQQPYAQQPAYQQPYAQQPYAQQPAPIYINNTATATNTVIVHDGKECKKSVALLLCFFLGYLGAHKFYEGKILLGIIYLFTFGLFGIGEVIDFIVLLFKPHTYYV